ncbi:MAG: asparaginase [Acidobacteria bacterium]|nr:asparaginase [Acidobacteriota bacterium]
MRRNLVVLGVLLSVIPTAAAGQSALPKVLIIGLGGTIAGEQREPGTLASYGITRTVEDLVRDVPVLKRYARVEGEQFLNISTRWLTSDLLLNLARHINTRLKERPDLAGIVVTHGTNKLEETAFFLHLTVKSDRPVVLVAAQRPGTGISPDGPINLLGGVRVAASRLARGKGTLVVMDERILSARDVTKLYARSGGFDAPEMGMLGVVGQEVEFFYAPARRHTMDSEFDVFKIQQLPRVDISYSYLGSDGANGGSRVEDVPIDRKAPASSLRPWSAENQKLYEARDHALTQHDARGVIVATSGFTPWESRYYEALARKGVVIAATFPSGYHVSSGTKGEDGPPVIGVQHMLPTKARILLMLALTKSTSPDEVQRIFDTY